MHVLLTGATGVLGRAMVERLTAEGHRVSVVTRRPFRAEASFASRVAIHEWHPFSEPLPGDAFAGVEAVLHMMGAPLAGGPSRGRVGIALSSRRATTRRLIEAISGRGLRLVVTSLALAPPSPGGSISDEALPGEPPSPSRVAKEISTWESETSEATGTSVAIVRLGLVAAAGEPLAALLRLAHSGLCPDLRGALVPAIALEDATAMLSGLLQRRELEGLIHGVAPVPLSGEAVMRALRTYAPMRTAIPLPVSLVGRRLGLISALISCHRQIVPSRLQAAGASYLAPDPMASLERALAEVEARFHARPWLERLTGAPPAPEAETGQV